MYAHTTRVLKDEADHNEETGLPAVVILRPQVKLTVLHSTAELLDKEAVCCNKATD